VPPLLRSCRHVLTNSHYTAAQIQRCTGLAAERISVIPLGYDSQAFRPAPQPHQTSAAAAGEAAPYLLHVGQAYPHKNLHRLIQVFSQLAPRYPQLRLVLAGKPHPSESPQLRRLVAELGLGRRVEFRPYVPFAELPDLYRGALALVYPSLWEGFGLPVLEAMACGTPVLTSLGSGTEEAAGAGALLVDPTNTAALAEAMQALVEQSALRQQLRQQGLLQASGFCWQRTAAATRAVVEGLL
jgi:glycosyltransferase involved in cell wall biosynthesis